MKRIDENATQPLELPTIVNTSASAVASVTLMGLKSKDWPLSDLASGSLDVTGGQKFQSGVFISRQV